MKFLNTIKNEHLWNEEFNIRFHLGTYETENEKEIEFLEKMGYKKEVKEEIKIEEKVEEKDSLIKDNKTSKKGKK